MLSHPNCPFGRTWGRSLAPKSCLGSFERGLQWSWGAAGQEPGHLLASGQAQFPSITRSKDGRTPPRQRLSHSPPKTQAGLPTRPRTPHSLARIRVSPALAQGSSHRPKARINCRRPKSTAQGSSAGSEKPRDLHDPGVYSAETRGFEPLNRATRLTP